MKRLRKIGMPAVLMLLAAATAQAADVQALKEATAGSLERHALGLADLSSRIWRYAEIALRETRSAEALAAYAEENGFRVRRGVAEMPTAFVAEYGSGRPIVGILGEYDALPGISQKAIPVKEALEPGGGGHGCGHNLFGPASLGAAVAVKELIEKGDLRGTIRFYGTPAEEAVGGKAYMLRAGLFEDLDAVLAWHPATETRADTRSSQAMVDLLVEFEGRAAHAAFDPWNGRSALDGLELFIHGLNLMREHVRPTVRMHYSILEGGGAPNVVPERASLSCWLRDVTRDGVDELMARVRKIAEGVALATEVESAITIQAGSYEMLPSRTGARLLHANLERLGPVPFTEEDQEFARTMQKNAGVETAGLDGSVQVFEENPPIPEGGSTDVADVSWNVPTIHLSVTTTPSGVPWHSWAVVSSSGSAVGRRGMMYAGRALAATMVDLFAVPGNLEAMRKEFREKTGGRKYRAMIPDGPPPVPKD